MKINGRRIAVIAILATVCLLLAINGYAPAHQAVEAAPEIGMRLAEPVPTPTVEKNTRSKNPDVTTKKGPGISLIPGVSGTIKIVNTIGDFSDFKCSDITVTTGQKWAQASGDFSKRQCRYALNNLPTGMTLTVRVSKPKRLNLCVTDFFLADEVSVSLKEGEHKNINLTISHMNCKGLR